MCQQTFLQKFQCQVHENTHRGIYKHACHLCGRGFTYQHALHGHFASFHHLQQYMVKCLLCDQTFTRKDHMRTHMKNLHNMNYAEIDKLASASKDKV